MDDKKSADRDRDGKSTLTKIQVRFPAEMMEAINNLAKKTGKSKAEVIRMVVNAALDRYHAHPPNRNQVMKGTMLSAEQAAAIRSALAGIFTELEAIRREINRIGTNFNQVVRAQNGQLKKTECSMTGRPCRITLSLYGRRVKKPNPSKSAVR